MAASHEHRDHHERQPERVGAARHQSEQPHQYHSSHKMRHGVATTLIAHQVPIGGVAEWMGDTEEMIVATYLHPTGHAVSGVLGRVRASKSAS